jgi:hypothetical protein
MYLNQLNSPFKPMHHVVVFLSQQHLVLCIHHNIEVEQ